MTAQIIPFHRPGSVPEARCKPPIIFAFNDHMIWAWGSREQLVEHGLATEEQFPVPPKRVAYSTDGKGGAHITARKDGYFVNHSGIRNRRHDDPLITSAKRITQTSEVSRSLIALNSLRSQFIDEREDHDRHSEVLRRFDSALMNLISVTLVMMK